MNMHGIAATLAALSLATAAAAATDVGQQEYAMACATCHGETGHGDGPLAELMTVPVPDLTGLTAHNGGEFPLLHVIQTIDGRSGIRGHGYPMPVWGTRFKEEIADRSGPIAAEILVRGRILSLAYYLESLQAPTE